MCLFKKCRNGSQKRQQQKDNTIIQKRYFEFFIFFPKGGFNYPSATEISGPPSMD